ncbi:hypothetical protein GDO81_011701 [Engystomops pustulosus]|uniref:Uncharacterized protein n=1 Tax=Engystomops pustulosus TaxID=76066 RepID=A0AAV7BGA5_ENGPU|nr:hypothetical protein GDO81_011701 [Engystomops pustulosus]
MGRGSYSIHRVTSRPGAGGSPHTGHVPLPSVMLKDLYPRLYVSSSPADVSGYRRLWTGVTSPKTRAQDVPTPGPLCRGSQALCGSGNIGETCEL